jgi:hypothetical protein
MFSTSGVMCVVTKVLHANPMLGTTDASAENQHFEDHHVSAAITATHCHA